MSSAETTFCSCGVPPETAGRKGRHGHLCDLCGGLLATTDTERVFDRVMQKFGCKRVWQFGTIMDPPRPKQTVSNWRKFGFPGDIQLELMDLADEKGIEITRDDFRIKQSNPSVRDYGGAVKAKSARKNLAPVPENG